MPVPGLAEAVITLLGGEGASTCRIHLAVGESKMVDLILEGKKTVETRFAETRQPPFGYVEPGDIIVFKKSGGPVVGLARATRAEFYSGLDQDQVLNLRSRFNDLIQADDEFWARKGSARYATFIHLSEVVKIEPVRIGKRDRRAWVVCEAENGGDSSSVFGLIAR